jgi:hypothetical protein
MGYILTANNNNALCVLRGDIHALPAMTAGT